MHVAHDCHMIFWEVFLHGISGQSWPTSEPFICNVLHPGGRWYDTNTCIEVGGELWQCLLVVGAICKLFICYTCHCS